LALREEGRLSLGIRGLSLFSTGFANGAVESGIIEVTKFEIIYFDDVFTEDLGILQCQISLNETSQFQCMTLYTSAKSSNWMTNGILLHEEQSPVMTLFYNVPRYARSHRTPFQNELSDLMH